MGIMSFMRSIRDQQSGNVFFALFGAVALVGVVGATSMQIMKGPVRSMSEVTKRTVAENNMIASAKLSLLAATSQSNDGDCDADGFVEPVPFENAGASPKPTGGGYLPSSLGAALNDPWDTRYGYCVWDHGAVTTLCGGGNFLAGANSNTGYALAIISAGPDRTFNTSCSAYPSANALNKTGGSDDIVLGYTYAEAEANSGGLWNLKSGNPNVAEINKNLEVKDSGGTTTFALDSQTGIGDFIGVITATIAGKAGAPLDITGNVKFEDSGVAIGGACTQTDSFAFDGTADKLVRCNGGTWEVAGADNLGNHTATTTLNMAGQNIFDTNLLGLRDANGNDGKWGGILSWNDAMYFQRLGIGGAWEGNMANINLTTGAFENAGSIRPGGNLILGSNWLSGDTDNEGLRVDGTGNVTIQPNGTPATTKPGAWGGGLTTFDIYASGTIGVGSTAGTLATTFNNLGDASIGRNTVIGGMLDVNGGAIHNTGTTPLYRMMNTAAPAGSRGWQIQNNGSLYFGTTDDSYGWQDSTILNLSRTGLVSIGGQLDMTNGKIINLQDPTAAQEATTKAYVDARVAAGTGFVEQDPQVGTITTPGRWCQSDGTAIVCDRNDPTVAGFGDNLGNHTATTALNMGGNWITSGTAGTGLLVNNGYLASNTTDATYDLWLEGAGNATRNLALLGVDGDSGDTLYVNHGSEYSGGTIIGGPVTISGTLNVTGGTVGGGDNLGNHLATQRVRFHSAPGSVGTGGPGSSDNLGAGGTTTGSLYSASGGYGYVGHDGNDFIRFDNNSGAYWQMNGTWSYGIFPTVFFPYNNNTTDLGTNGNRWKDLWMTGTVTAGGAINANGMITVNNGSPTLVLQDTDHRSGYIHVNSNQMYFLTGPNNAGYGGWALNGSYWPLQIDLASDVVTVGGQLNLAEGNLNLGSQAVVGSAGTVIDAGGGWIRTYGNAGWYNGTHGGGWNMEDSTWLRAYGSKSVYTPAVVRADSGIHTNQICNTSGTGCIAQSSLASGGGDNLGAGGTTSGNVISTSSVQAPIFYDTNNTGYYLDPHATSVLNDIRPTIMYDLNNTSYYVDPASTSVLNVSYQAFIYDLNNSGYYLDGNGTSRMNFIAADNIQVYGTLTAGAIAGEAGCPSGRKHMEVYSNQGCAPALYQCRNGTDVFLIQFADQCGGGGSCFVAGTMVTMADGSTKPIDKLQVGDVVLGRDGVHNKVTGMQIPTLSKRRLYAFNGEKAFVTSEHPFMLTTGQWASISPKATHERQPEFEKRYGAVKALEVGDVIVREGNETFTIKSIDEHRGPADMLVYNPSLDGNKTYYADGYLVHNRD